MRRWGPVDKLVPMQKKNTPWYWRRRFQFLIGSVGGAMSAAVEKEVNVDLEDVQKGANILEEEVRVWEYLSFFVLFDFVLSDI